MSLNPTRKRRWRRRRRRPSKGHRIRIASSEAQILGIDSARTLCCENNFILLSFFVSIQLCLMVDYITGNIRGF
uniref:Uncharacterized protein MANES_03G078900 n=1 Tax=Rhizophora mucronata TaxID=61149 RepID=A0A2P2R271_RHIMU